jgi:hypothetical protein
VLVLAIVLVLLIGAAATVLLTGRGRMLRGAGYGAVAGAYFGTLAVMVDAAADQAGDHGVRSLVTTPRGLVPLIGILVLGGAGILLTQMSFQVGALGATLPANLAADPLVGVVLGVVLLREHIPLSPGHVIAYLACLAAVIAGAVRLADPHAGPIEIEANARGESATA